MLSGAEFHTLAIKIMDKQSKSAQVPVTAGDFFSYLFLKLSGIIGVRFIFFFFFWMGRVGNCVFFFFFKV